MGAPTAPPAAVRQLLAATTGVVEEALAAGAPGSGVDTDSLLCAVLELVAQALPFWRQGAKEAGLAASSVCDVVEEEAAR